MTHIFLSILLMIGWLQPEFQESEPDSIESNLILGMGDLFWQTGVHYSSLDRMSFQVNSGLYGYHGPQPSFILNDIPFDPKFFGVSFSQLIPEPLFRIQKMEYREGSGIYRGIGYSSDLINITSEPLKNGITVFASGQYGHNKGEPGPWVFDPNRVSPNVERFGPWVDAGMAMKFGGWYAKGVIRTHNNKNMDVFVQTRMSNLRGNAPDNEFYPVDSNTVLGLIETGFESRMFDLRLQAIQSNSDDYLYFQPLAREVPSQLEFEQFSALANFYFNEKSGIRTLFQHREKNIGYRRNRFMHDFGWNKTIQSARASVFYEGSRNYTDIGIEHERSEAIADGLTDGNLFLTRLHLQQHVDIHDAVRLGTSNLISIRESELAFQSSGFMRLRLTNSWIAEIEGGYSELFPEIANPTEFWVNRGYTIFDQLEIPVLLPEIFANHQKTSFSITNDFHLSESFSMDLGLLWINHISMNIPFQQAQYDLPYSTTPGMYTFYEGQSGQRYRANLGIHHTPSPKFNQSIKTWINRTYDGDEMYKKYWKTIPEYFIHYSAEFSPYPDIELNLHVQYRSVTKWAEFEDLDGEMNRTFHVQYPFSVFHFSKELPEHLNATVSASKWFWEQRLRAAVMLKNLFNANYQTHPLGTRENFGYLVRVELRL